MTRDAIEAVEKVRQNGIDLLILDFRKPIFNGLAIYIELKKEGKAVPTIIVTAHANRESDEFNEWQPLSVTGILHKPFDPGELLHALESLELERAD